MGSINQKPEGKFIALRFALKKIKSKIKGVIK